MSLSLPERIHPDRFRRGEKPAGDELVLSHRRIFILPTRAGVLCALLLGVMLLASIVYNNSLGFVLTFLLAAILLVSIFHTFNALTGLCVAAGRLENVFAGDSAQCVYIVRNPSGSARLQVGFQLQAESPMAVDLQAASTTRVELYKRTDRRGPLSPGTLTVSTIYPLGLFRAWSPLRFRKFLLVYPRPSERAVDWSTCSSQTGNGSAEVSGSDDFTGLRPYQPGESARRIHWKALARQRGIYTRQYATEQHDELWFDLEQVRAENLEAQLSLLCRMILEADRLGLRYGLRLPGRVLSPAGGEIQRAECLQSLAMFGMTTVSGS